MACDTIKNGAPFPVVRIERHPDMSCDFGVWFPDKRLSDQEAGEVYSRLCNGVTDDVLAHPEVDAFYQELTAMHPEIDDIPEEEIDNHDLCPWSVQLDRSPGHIIMACVWSKAEYVDGLIRSLARKHRLAVYDPQAGRISYPDESREAPDEQRSWWRFW